MKDKHLWKFRKISGNDLEIVLISVFYNLILMRNSSMDKDRHFLDQGKNLKEKIKKKFGKGLEKFKREVEELSVCVWGGIV